MLNFGKLFKFEWKNTSKVSLLILLYLGIATAIGCSAFLLPVWERLAGAITYGTDLSLLDMISFFSASGFIIIYAISVSAAATGLTVYFAVTFYQSMYSRRGYLTHTLPVNSHALLCSKILTYGLWSLIYIIATVVSAGIFFTVCIATITRVMGGSTEAFSYILNEFFKVLQNEFYNITGTSFVVYIITILFGGLIQSFSSIILVLTAITIGQLSAKHKVLMSIVSYLGVMFINFMVGLITSAFTTSYTLPSQGETLNLYTPQLISIAISAALAVGGYILSSHIIRNKLNLQ
ncbi:MAG: hypothetical protein LBM60_07565 [Clostridium sp.]|jgi:hypothetical protein|nr:hypothetical protein [Clostridium sp.]